MSVRTLDAPTGGNSSFVPRLDSETKSGAALLDLQRVYGNQMVQRFLRANTMQRSCQCGGTCAECNSRHTPEESIGSQPYRATSNPALHGGEREDGSQTGPLGGDFWSGVAGAGGGLVTGAGIGFNVGGPIGALIGAGVGGIAGGVTALTSSASLAFDTVTARTASNCGGYTYAVKWKLNGATAANNGFVVQKVRFNHQREICGGGRDDFTKTYWEAWQVRNGDIFVGTSASRHRADTFSTPGTPGERGTTFEEGNARYIEGYTLPFTWGTVPEAGSLPATTSPPLGWFDAGTIHRSVNITFDCCKGTDAGTMTGDG